MELEPFSNPLAPPSAVISESHGSAPEHPLTNADFRKLLMTPRVVAAGQTERSCARSVRASERGSRPKTVLKEELNENRKKKKKFYASLKKHEEDTLAELAKKYRDRAKERRDGANPDYHEQSIAQTAAYRAVAPDFKSSIDAAERRKQMIQESKYLGGDMQHTHLVKGLDYALLQKVRAEIQMKEKEEFENEEIEDDEEVEKKPEELNKSLPDVPDVPLEADDPFAIRSLYAQAVVRNAKPAIPERNELFLPGRMAYIVDLEDECAESDIPTTVIRSKAECPNLESINTLSTNDIVINKLMQIIAYIREGGSSKKTKKNKEKSANQPEKHQKVDNKISKTNKTEESIFDDVGDYVPELKRRDGKDKNRERERHRTDYDHHHDYYRDRDKNDRRERERKSSSYFEKNEEETRKDYDKDVRAISSSAISGANLNELTLKGKSLTKLDQEAPDSYAECYPGAPENDDAILDSDDEVDYSKMDMGNKKGVIGRWDFDTAEEYGDYMSHKEALPKAAFQYGVKMADGRKTRRGQPKNDKAKLDRDLQKINAIIAKRKAEGEQGGSSTVTFNTQINDHKKHKYN